MIRILRSHWPLATAVAMLWSGTALCIRLSGSWRAGHVVYALDDAYIHMAIARNLAEHGVWGVTRYGFTSASSSLLWTLLLAALGRLFGVHELWPLALNLTFATLVCVVAYRTLASTLPARLTFGALALLVLATPLIPLALSGLEHTLHLLLTLMFLTWAAAALSEPADCSKLARLVTLAPLLVAARFEGLFLLAIVGLFFALRGRPLYALGLLAAGCLPVVLYGCYSLANGWYFLPNSLLLKGNIPDFSSTHGLVMFLGYSVYEQLFGNPHLLMLVMAALILFCFGAARTGGMWHFDGVATAAFILTLLLHLQFAKTGWFYRYEAYLVGLGVYVVFHALGTYLPRKSRARLRPGALPQYAGIAGGVLLVVAPLALRGGRALWETPRAMTNIYEQHYQVGLFLRQFYSGSAIAASDLGAMNYLADIRCLDVWGLGTREVGRAKREERFNMKTIEALAKAQGVRIAMLYDEWFEYDASGKVPRQWVKVGEWTIPRNVVCRNDTLSFYAVGPGEAAYLAQSLRAFSQRLPQDVAQTGKYTRSSRG